MFSKKIKTAIAREVLCHDVVCAAAELRSKASEQKRDAKINSARQTAQESQADVKRLEQTVTQLEVASKAGRKALLKGEFFTQLTAKNLVISSISKGLLTAENQDILLKRTAKERDAAKQLAAKCQKRIVE